MGLSIADFKKKLEEEHSFPTVYMFKFIVTSDKEEEVLGLLPSGDITSKLSKEGKYTSVTARLMMSSSDEVVEIYNKMNTVEGLIAL